MVMLMTDDKKIPQNRIAELRKEKNLSQAELAKKTGLTRQAISLYEISKREPKLETWIKLADFFDVPVSYLQGLGQYNYSDKNEIKRRSDEFDKRLGFTPQDDEDPEMMWISPGDLNFQMRDSTLKTYLNLINLFLSQSNKENWVEISEDVRKKLRKKANSLNDKEIDEIVHYASMAFYLLLSKDNEDKESLIKIIDDFYSKYISDYDE